MDIKEIKRRAKEDIKPYIRNFIPIILVFIFIDCSLTIPNAVLKYLVRKNHVELATISNVFNIINGLVEGFITPILTMALLCLIAKIAKKKDNEEMPEISFKAFLSHFNMAGRAILNDLYTGLWLFIWAIPAVIVSLIILRITNSSLGILLMIILILTVMIYKTLSYYFNSYAIADDNETEVIEAMNISKIITKGHLREVLLLDLSFIGWGLLSILTLGFALIWVQPYMTLSLFYAYQELVKESDSIDVKPLEEPEV